MSSKETNKEEVSSNKPDENKDIDTKLTKKATINEIIRNDVIQMNEWHDEHEDILAEWAEKAMCYRWLHHRSHMYYKKKNAMFTIPVIIISTLTGTANFALDRFNPSTQDIAVMVIGGLNIAAAIISTVSQFLKISEINEGHRVASIAWDKFYRNVKLELSKAPNERRNVGEMLKISKEEYDRLIETSPMVQDNIIKLFKSSFNYKQMKDDLSLPEILDDLEKVEKYSRTPDSVKQILSKIPKKDLLDNLKKVVDVKDIKKSIKKSVKNKVKKTVNEINKNPDEFVIEMTNQISGLSKNINKNINKNISNQFSNETNGSDTDGLSDKESDNASLASTNGSTSTRSSFNEDLN